MDYKTFRSSLEDKEIEKVGDFIKENYLCVYCVSHVNEGSFTRYASLEDKTWYFKRSIDKCFFDKPSAVNYFNEHRGTEPKLLTIDTSSKSFNLNVIKKLKQRIRDDYNE